MGQTNVPAPCELMNFQPQSADQEHFTINLYNSIYTVDLRVLMILHPVILLSLQYIVSPQQLTEAI